MGAIRWDAWYDPDSIVGRATTSALSPKEYQFRLPFFARKTDPNHPTIDGGHQSIIDKEIGYAVQAGLSFWAFVSYSEDSPLTKGLDLYFSSKYKRLINFCMIVELTRWKTLAQNHVTLMTDPTYQTVLNDRPLYFLGFLREDVIQSGWGGRTGLRQALDAFRSQIIQNKVNNPYIVILDYNPGVASNYARDLGCDAIGTYAINHNPRGAPFRQLMREAEQDWIARAATGLPIIPMITTGFDQRPRIKSPPPWDAQRADRMTQMQFYYDTGRPAEIKEELEDCIQWLRANPRAAPAKTALVYAWNENDEGGWIIPTYPDDIDRVKTMHEGLCRRSLSR